MVDEIYNKFAAKKMGIEFKGQVCVMIHCGSRGLGHQVATGKSFYFYFININLCVTEGNSNLRITEFQYHEAFAILT